MKKSRKLLPVIRDDVEQHLLCEMFTTNSSKMENGIRGLIAEE